MDRSVRNRWTCQSGTCGEVSQEHVDRSVGNSWTCQSGIRGEVSQETRGQVRGNSWADVRICEYVNQEEADSSVQSKVQDEEACQLRLDGKEGG